MEHSAYMTSDDPSGLRGGGGGKEGKDKARREGSRMRRVVHKTYLFSDSTKAKASSLVIALWSPMSRKLAYREKEETDQKHARIVRMSLSCDHQSYKDHHWNVIRNLWKFSFHIFPCPTQKINSSSVGGWVWGRGEEGMVTLTLTISWSCQTSAQLHYNLYRRPGT